MKEASSGQLKKCRQKEEQVARFKEEMLRKLSILVGMFMEKTEGIDLLKPVVSTDIKEADEILLQLHLIMKGVSNEM